MKVEIELKSDVATFLRFIVDTDRMNYFYEFRIPMAMNFRAISVKELKPEQGGDDEKT